MVGMFWLPKSQSCSKNVGVNVGVWFGRSLKNNNYNLYLVIIIVIIIIIIIVVIDITKELFYSLCIF